MSLIGLDLGEKRVGVAVSHGVVAEAYKILPFDEKEPQDFIDNIKRIITEQKTTKIIVGLPLGRDGKETKQSEWTRRQVEELLESLGVAIDFVEESFSSTEARAGLSVKYARERIDSLSAKIILDQYLNETRSSSL